MLPIKLHEAFLLGIGFSTVSWWSLVIFVVGTVWRLAGILLLRRKPDYTEPRSTGTWRGAASLIVKRTVPKREFAAQTAFGNTIGYVFHIGLAIVVLGNTAANNRCEARHGQGVLRCGAAAHGQAFSDHPATTHS